MKKYRSIVMILPLLVGAYFYLLPKEQDGKFKTEPKTFETISYGSNGIGAEKGKQGRKEWELQRLKDPVTGEIPAGHRRQELIYANKLLNNTSRENKSLDWVARGPYNVGGRTRAFALDVRDEKTIWAGAVSGGIWRSEDEGKTWEKITPSTQIQNVTALVQDTRPGEEDTWYYGTGEALGNSPSGPGAFYLGNGLYKTTDNGETWASLNSTASNTPASFDNRWDLVFRLVIDSTEKANDVVYAAALGSILRSEDGGTTWNIVLGNLANSSGDVTDISITAGGTLYATLSSSCEDNGVWRSTDGQNWTNITSSLYAPVYNRIVIGVNPSNEDEVYFLATTPGSGQASNTFIAGQTEENSLWKYEFLSGNGSGSAGNWTDLSASLPHGNASPFDNFYAQGAYDLLVKVKPDDEDVIIIGGTNLYRSTDGFTTGNNTTIIGGYEQGTRLPNFQIYDNHHPDQHDVTFLPSNPDVMLSASDGGVHRTDDIYASTVDWTSLNNGYRSTQLYTVGFNPATTDDILIGGFQDNGNFFTPNADPKSKWVLPLNGDGAFMGITNAGNPYYLSIQRGKIFKMDINTDGSVNGFRRIDPIGAEGHGFINPFVLDPNNNDVLYMPAGTRLWRNTNLSAIQLTNEYDSISQGWTYFSDTLTEPGEQITAIAVSKTPANIVYYGTNSGNLYRVADADTKDTIHKDITKTRRQSRFDAFPTSGTINSIAINPNDADEVLIAFSNYNVESLFHTKDGGDNWIKAGGNLDNTSVALEPSCRSVSILPFKDELLGIDTTIYLVGTSVGLFSTDTIIDKATAWKQIQTDLIGNVVVEMVQTRTTDGLIAIATHGNGIYTTKLKASEDTVGLFENSLVDRDRLRVYPNPSSGIVNIGGEDFQLNDFLIVRDLKGKEMLRTRLESTNESLMQVNLSGLGAGVYFIILGDKTSKVILTE